ncbi:MAG: tetratricopeptide repeat-containing serine protease family protein, partial [Verrucomicrobiota bacterium]
MRPVVHVLGTLWIGFVVACADGSSVPREPSATRTASNGVESPGAVVPLQSRLQADPPRVPSLVPTPKDATNLPAPSPAAPALQKDPEEGESGESKAEVTSVTSVAAGRTVEESLAQLEPSFWYNLALSNHLDHLAKGHPTNLTTAIEAYRKASDGDCAPALVNLGYAHDLGMGVPFDPGRAAEFYQRAADLGNPIAAYNLGRKYFTGTNGLPLDWSASQRYLQRAAEDGLLAAQHLLGQLLLEQGRTVEAQGWFNLAAEHGYIPSMYSLANLVHYGGKGVPQDLPRAVQWYQRAAAEDFVPAQFQLAVLFDHGPGVQNSVLAESFLRKASERGHREAQYLLGEYYYRGRVVPMDLAEAYRWWSLASASGLEVATVARRQLERILPEGDRERGRRLVTDFHPIASNYRDAGIAQIRANARPPSMVPLASGAGFVVSDSGHVVTCTPASNGEIGSFVVSLVGGRLSADKVTTDPTLGLSVVKVDGGGKMFHPLPLQTHRSHIMTGAWVFCAHLETGKSLQDRLKQVSLRTRIARPTGMRADPRQFCLGNRLPETFRGAAVLDDRGEVLGIVVDPDPCDSTLPGALVLTSRHLRDYLRAHGINPALAPEAGPEPRDGESAPTVSPHAGNSLVSVAALG